MTDEEVNEISSLINTKKDGQFDYAEVSLTLKPTTTYLTLALWYNLLCEERERP